MVATIIINSYTANACYLSLHLRYENAYAFYTSLLADLKMMPEYSEDTEIAIVGQYQEPYFYWDEFPFTYSMYGTGGFIPTSHSSYFFLQYYIGTTIPFASDEKIAQIAATQEYADMAVYPYYGSLKMIGDTLVVKLS